MTPSWWEGRPLPELTATGGGRSAAQETADAKTDDETPDRGTAEIDVLDRADADEPDTGEDAQQSDASPERHWLWELVNQAGLAGTTAHVPAPTTTTYGQPAGPVPSAARHRARRRRAGRERARRGLLGRSLLDRVPRGARPSPSRAAAKPSGVTARGVAAVVARGVARVPRPGEPPPESPRPPPRAATRRVRRIPVGPLALVVLLIGVFATGFGLHHLTAGRIGPGLFSADYRQPPRKVDALRPSRPTGIVIPTLGLRAAVHSVGLAPDGAIDVPPLERHQEAGWFDRSPTPGELGPSIIVGHVDSSSGPSVFHGLKRLQRGDKVEILRQDGSEAVFVVESVERFDKRALPNDRVYGDYQSPNLRLITCGGQWVGGTTGYADNVIVFASLISTSRRG